VFVKTCTNEVQVVSDLNACWKIVLKCNHCKTWNAALVTALLRCSGLRWVWSIALGSTILITLTFKLFYFRIRDCDDIFDLNEAGSASSMSLPVFVVQQMSTPMLTGESVPRRVTISSFRKFWMSRSRVFYILFLISCFIEILPVVSNRDDERFQNLIHQLVMLRVIVSGENNTKLRVFFDDQPL